MKKIIIPFLLCMFIIACDSDSTSDVSTITNYPTFTYDPLVVVPLGGTFEATAIAKEGDTEIPVTVGGDEVNVNQVGIYVVSYSATNKDGFEANAVQTVVVHDPSIVGTDVSGNVRDKNNNARTAVITLVPGTTSIFHSTDFGFAGLFPMYFQMDGDVISEIPQTYPLGQTSVDLTYDPVNKIFTTLIHPAGFGYTFEYF